MKLTERHYWLGFNIFPGIGPKRFYHLLKFFGSANKAWYASKKQLLNTQIPHSIVNKFLDFRKKINLNSEIIRLEKRLIRFYILEDNNYPINLRKIKNPPPILYIKGRIVIQDKYALSVVGSRKITPYGREVTEKIVTGLVAKGLTIVSGLARGVDSLAHRLALGNNGRTIAVLGCGLDNIYPPEHKALAQEILECKRGALVSILPLGIKPLRGHFPQRNRVIAGLSLGVLVTEGASVSGTKITCQYIKEQNKPIFAVPGPITSSLSQGPAELIQEGAKLVTKAEDILNNIKASSSQQPAASTLQTAMTNVSSPEIKMCFSSKPEQQIYKQLVNGKKHIDDIIRQVKLPPSKVLSCLTELELKGMVKNISSGWYMIV